MSGLARVVHEARLDSLAALLGFVEDSCRREGVRADDAFALRLAVEEACTNVIRHGYPEAQPGPLALGFEVADGRAVITLEDRAVVFDPASVAAPDLESGWRERTVGGLGWHLIRQMIDEVHHEARDGGGNRLTLVKHLASVESLNQDGDDGDIG
jgi:serine/threonine-protein kinase RsbW